jgi:hypothetical protein
MIDKVNANNKKRVFEVEVRERLTLDFPYALCEPSPTPEDRIEDLHIDDEVAREGFTYTLASGLKGTILYDWVLYYHRDPSFMTDLLLYELTVEALKALKTSRLARREVIRRLGTSASQFYRLIDTTNHRKSMRQVIELLGILGRKVNIEIVPSRNPLPVRD